MARILMALSFGAVSLVIVFISGLMSGVVRLGTVTLRSLLAFCVSSVIVFFILFAFDTFDEKIGKKLAALNAEIDEEQESEDSSREEGSEEETQSEEETAEGTNETPNR